MRRHILNAFVRVSILSTLGISLWCAVALFRIGRSTGLTPLFGTNLQSAFDLLRPGMTTNQVLVIMKQNPYSTNPEFTLGQVAGFEKEYERAARSNGVIFYTWVTDIDMFYCVGFDKEGKLVVKGKGGT